MRDRRSAASEDIRTQTLAVSVLRSPSHRELLVYCAGHLAGQEPPKPAKVPIGRWQALRRDIEEVRRRIERLTQLALAGEPRGELGIEEPADTLARHILPPSGFCGMFPPGIHPQFDGGFDIAAEIPWEVLEEHFTQCPRCQETPRPAPAASPPGHCPRCGSTQTVGGGKLALTHHLTHLVRGRRSRLSDGREFLVVEDPTEDLCRPDRDPAGVCRAHLDRLRERLEVWGFEVSVLAGPNATVSHVLSAISSPDVAGIYYFGHGHFPREADQGRLVLSDGHLFASRIEEASPAARLVFLNACEGAVAGHHWDVEQRARSVAHAFAQGNHAKAVISPLWPVVNTQAAEMADAFFEWAAKGLSVGWALHHAREASLRRYEAGEAHLSWMAYRLFNDPNQLLPIPAGPGAAAAARHAASAFDGAGRFCTERFAFEMGEILLRAAKRRSAQGRRLIRVTDLIAGLVRRGALTRHLLRQVRRDPDALYDEVCALDECDPSALRQSAERENRDRWTVKHRQDFDDDTACLLETVAAKACGRGPEGDRRITEFDLLGGISGTSAWARLPGLPPQAAILGLIAEVRGRQEIDANGCLVLADLDAEARRVIDMAHMLAQQRGLFPVPSGLLLAALLADQRGTASRALRAAGGKPGNVFFRLVALHGGEGNPTNYDLSPEACDRIILPVIEEARKLAASESPGSPVGERHLFRAICRNTDPQLIDAARYLIPGGDLRRLEALEETSPEN